MREKKKSSEEQMKRKRSIRYKTTQEGNGEISGLKMKGFGMERNGAQGNFQVEDESKKDFKFLCRFPVKHFYFSLIAEILGRKV